MLQVYLYPYALLKDPIGLFLISQLIYMPFSFLDVLLIIGISQGIFLATSLLFVHERNLSANRILSFILFIAVIVLFGRVMVHRIEGLWLIRVGVAVDATIYLFGPLIYLYVRRLLFKEEGHTYHLGWQHYIPLLLYVVYATWTYTISLVDLDGMYRTGQLYFVFLCIEGGGLLSLGYYLFRSHGLIRRFKRQEPQMISYSQEVYRFLQMVIGVLVVFGVIWAFSFTSAYFFRRFYPFVNYNTMWITTPAFFYVIGYFALRQPEIFKIPITSMDELEKPRLSPGEILKLQKRLNFFMDEEQLYLRQDLTLKSLAQQMDATPNDVSWLLNKVYQKPFYDFINEYRVKEFLVKINNHEYLNHTLLSLAMDAGFNTKSTFNKTFKAVTGQTPSSYIKSKKVA